MSSISGPIATPIYLDMTDISHRTCLIGRMPACMAPGKGVKRRSRMKPQQGTALILGASGQDGAYLADLLVRRGLKVHGTSRDKEVSSYAGLHRLGIHSRVTHHSAVLSDFRSVVTVLNNIRPALIFNLAAQSSVGLSFEQPVETIDSIMHGTINVMEAMRFLGLDAKFYNAGSSECFGNTGMTHPADETTAFSPRSPYAVGKAASFWAVANYREAYGLWVCSGLLFNHESPLRPARYVTQKIVRSAVEIAAGRRDTVELGMLNIARDWGWAPEYVDAMARMLELDTPEDFVIATGETRTLKDFVAAAFARVGLNWCDHVVENPALHRPIDIMYSSGDPSKAARLLGWKAEKKMVDVVNLLVDAELGRCAAEGAAAPKPAEPQEAARRSA
jgi:GDPmannose 4,6-dehydratase